MSQQIEAVFEKGVFRPLRPVDLPEFQRVTLVLPERTEIADSNTLDPDVHSITDDGMFDDRDEIKEEFGYEPLPLRECKMIRVKFQMVGEIPPLPYPIDNAELEINDDLE